jgi:hypothetical protein
MKTTLIDHYEFAFDEQDVLRFLGMPAEHIFGESIKRLLRDTKEIAKPKSLFFECPIDYVDENGVKVGDVYFQSELLARNLQKVKLIYPYVSTCGTELSAYAKTLTDTVDKFAFDAIMEFYEKKIDLALEAYLVNMLEEMHVLSKSNPGSLLDWPIQEQKKLFALFGESIKEIGVELNDNYLMSPLKTVSGVRYGAKEKNHDCIYCQRKNCSYRKAPYDAKAYFATLHRE